MSASASASAPYLRPPAALSPLALRESNRDEAPAAPRGLGSPLARRLLRRRSLRLFSRERSARDCDCADDSDIDIASASADQPVPVPVTEVTH